MQDGRRLRIAGPQLGNAVLVSQRIKATRRAHVDAVGIGDAGELGDHAAGLAPQHEPPRLAPLAVEPQAHGPLPHDG
jgi:hypothetical protein